MSEAENERKEPDPREPWAKTSGGAGSLGSDDDHEEEGASAEDRREAGPA